MKPRPLVFLGATTYVTKPIKTTTARNAPDSGIRQTAFRPC